MSMEPEAVEAGFQIQPFPADNDKNSYGTLEITIEDMAPKDSQTGVVQRRTQDNKENISHDETEDSSADLAKEPLKLDCEPRSRSLKAFGNYARSRVNDIDPKVHLSLLMACCGLIVYLVMQHYGNAATTLDIVIRSRDKIGNSPATLSAGEAIVTFLRDIVSTTLFILIYNLTWILVWPLQLEAKVLVGLILTTSPILYVAELADKASGVGVDCGLFSLPLIGFAILGSLALAFICGSIIVFTSYCSWKRGKEKDIMLDYAISSVEKNQKIPVD